MTTTLQNLERRKQLFSLDHPVFRLRRWGYQVATVREHTHNPRTGAVAYREVKKKHAGTLTLLGGASIAGLPDEIAAVPSIARALRASPPRVRLIVEGNVEGASNDATATPAARAKGPRGRSRGRSEPRGERAPNETQDE